MKCYLCQNKTFLKRLDRPICKKCFIRQVEKRIKKSLKIKRNSKVLVLDDLSQFFLKKVNIPLKITRKEKLPKKISSYQKIILTNTLDDFCDSFLQQLFAKEFKIPKQPKKYLYLFQNITDKDLQTYAQLNKIKFKPKKKSKYYKLLENLSQNNPEFKYGLFNSYKDIRKVF